MEALQLIVLLLALYTKMSKTSPPCSWTQITQINSNMTTCLDCPKCPHGFGLTPQCASYITAGEPIQCVPCVNGVTYSDSHDISSCKPCSICGENEITIRPCNVTHNAICGKCKPGFYREITEDCWPCTKCCEDSTSDDHEIQCLHQGFPAKQSCRLNFKTEACATAPAKPTAKLTVKLNLITTEAPSHRSCKSGSIVNSTIIVVKYYQTINNNQLWMDIGISMIVIFAVGIPVTIFIICRPRYGRGHSFNYLIEKEKNFELAVV